ncbi:MAG: PAS domain S-box protein, partial [Saprospiraceae bacterium]|nr:PAS domain S-box protein [Pyrinomonadaceae bacterium]
MQGYETDTKLGVGRRVEEFRYTIGDWGGKLILFFGVVLFVHFAYLWLYWGGTEYVDAVHSTVNSVFFFAGFISLALAAGLKRSGQALRNSEEQHRLLFENNPQPSYIWDIETLAFIAVNDATVRQYGYSREELLTKMTLKDIRLPEDVPDFLERISKKAPERQTILAPFRHRKKDGTLIDVEVTSHILNFNG